MNVKLIYFFASMLHTIESNSSCSGGTPVVGRRNESCRHKWLLLGGLNGHFLIQRDLDVPSSSVSKKYDGTSNMAEFRSSSPTPSKLCWNRGYYISNLYCNVIILVRVLVVQTK